MWNAERIKNLRKAYGETQEEFARRFRVSLETVRWWEQGKGKGNIPGPATVLLDQLESELPEPAAVKAG